MRLKIGERKSIKELIDRKTFSPTARAMFQASYPDIDIGTSTMDEYFNGDASIWGNIRNVRHVNPCVCVF